MRIIRGVREYFQRHPRAEWLIPAALCFIFMAQLLLSVRQMSQHADEATHLYAGYRALKCGDYTFGREHPPLSKMLVAIPLIWSNARLDCAQGGVGAVEFAEATDWLYSQEDWWSLLMRARLVASFAAVLLCLGVWVAAREMFGRMAATLSLALLVFEPNILGHGALLLNDTLVSALIFFTVFGFYRWTRRRTAPLLVGTGLLAGLALLTKHSAVVLPVVLVLLAVAEASWETRGKGQTLSRALRNAGAVAAVALISLATIWSGYGMRYIGGIRRAADSARPEQMAKMNSAELQVLKAMRTAHLLPQPYVDGLFDVSALVGGGPGASLLGRYYSEAPWFYVPLTAIIKLTLPFLAILAMGGAGLILFGTERRKESVFLSLPVLLFLAASMCVPRFSGIWHLFPMFPFMVIAAAGGCVYVARRYHWASVTLIWLVGLHAVSSLHCYPNYLSYANEAWGGPHNLYKHLPYTDVGQTFWQVRRYMEQHPNTPCWLENNFWVPADRYGVPCVHMGELNVATDVPPRMKGIVFVSSTALEAESLTGGPLSPFYAAQPTARLGGSAMLVYEGDFDTRIAAARALTIEAVLSLYDRRIADAINSTRRAIDLAPSYARAHELYCVLMASDSKPREGLSECSIALRLLLTDPKGGKEAEMVMQNMKLISATSGLPLPRGVE